MTLDLIVRGTGSGRSASEHVAALLGEYAGAHLIVYGDQHDLAGDPRPICRAADPEALAEAIQGAGDAAVLIYGDESVLSFAQNLELGLIWITLGSDANGVREIWRVRQQHSWLSTRKVALLIEHVTNSPPPDTERMLRLTRATKAVLVTAPAMDQAAPALEMEAPTLDTEAPNLEPEAPADTAESVITIESEGADEAMETNTVTASAPAHAQEALIQRYSLVQERRATSARITQAEESMHSLLKDIFVARFAAGPDAAASFEALARKLTDASAEFTHLSRKMAELEQDLSKLAWLKDELEI